MPVIFLCLPCRREPAPCSNPAWLMVGFWGRRILLPDLVRRIDRENNLGRQFGYSFEGLRSDNEVAGVGLSPCLNSDAEAPIDCSVPQRPLRFGKCFNQPTERTDSGIGRLNFSGNFEVRAVLSAVPPRIENKHLPTEPLYKWLEVVFRVGVKIDVQKVCSWRMVPLYRHDVLLCSVPTDWRCARRAWRKFWALNAEA
jgi:hypothetical protein